MKVPSGKGRTLALVVAVLAIWAVIAVQVLSAFEPSGETPAGALPTSRFELQKIKPRDTFDIYNDYRDPFSGKLPPGRSLAAEKQAPGPKKETVRFPEIRYQGAVSNSAGRDMVFSLSVNGEGILLSEGGTYQGMRLLKGDADQVVLELEGERKTFAR